MKTNYIKIILLLTEKHCAIFFISSRGEKFISFHFKGKQKTILAQFLPPYAPLFTEIIFLCLSGCLRNDFRGIL